MNEHYLHIIWNKKRLSFHQLNTTQNDSVEILHTGEYNALESGPDFTMAKARIDGLVWVGSIEIHVKSSDWYKHKHHLDHAYNNVILHVVYEHDMDVTIAGRTLPVIELKNHIDSNHYLKYTQLKVKSNKNFPCESLFNEKHHIELERMKIQAVESRLLSKTSETYFSHKESDCIVFLKLAAHAFGTAVNAQPFEQLINSFSLEELIKFDEKQKNAVLSNFLWKRKGLVSDPKKRINQFINFIQVFDSQFHFWDLPASMMLMYAEQQFKKAKISSKFLLCNFLINCVVPFVFWKGNKTGNRQLMEKANRLLGIIPKESNHFTRKWEYIGIRAKNAFDSQALLEIYKQFCIKKACLDCAVGKKIIKL